MLFESSLYLISCLVLTTCSKNASCFCPRLGRPIVSTKVQGTAPPFRCCRRHQNNNAKVTLHALLCHSEREKSSCCWRVSTRTSSMIRDIICHSNHFVLTASWETHETVNGELFPFFLLFLGQSTACTTELYLSLLSQVNTVVAAILLTHEA